jgi:iron complex outermembrane receptor protein
MRKISFISLLCLPCAAYAQEAAQDSLRSIEEVVVTANRTEVNRSNVPMTISVVGRDELEQSSESALLSVLSGRIPGMFVTERGVTGFGVGSSAAGNISLRGVGGGNELLVLIDGHPQYMGVMGHHMPDAYVTSDAEKVEVVRGPASILYGSNAMGGVVNIITRKQHTDGWNANARLMYGSYNTQKYMGNAGLKTGKLDAFVSLNHDRTDGYRPRSDFHITNGYAKLGYKFSNHFKLWGDMSLASFKVQNPGLEAAPMVDNIADILRGVASISLENNYEKTDGALKFFYNFGDHNINDGYEESGTPPAFNFRSKDHNYGITWYQVFRPLEGNMITAGLDFKNFGGKAWNDFHGHAPDEVQVDTSLYEVAGYLIMQQTLFEKLTVNAGVRLERNEQFGHEWIPQAGLAYRPHRSTVLKASVSKGFRSPNIRELYYREGWAGANPDLKPERMWSYEISVGQDFLDGGLSFELVGFIANGSDLIVTDWSSGYPPKNYNTGQIKNRGAELSFRWHAFKNFNLQGSYSFLHTDTPLLYSPKHQIFLAAGYRLAKWGFSLNGRFVDGLYSEIGNSPAVESFATLDARVSFQLLRQLGFFVKGENLTDRSYQIITGYPMPGITVFGGVNVSLR